MSCLDSSLRIEGKVSGDKMIVEFEVIQRSHEHTKLPFTKNCHMYLFVIDCQFLLDCN